MLANHLPLNLYARSLPRLAPAYSLPVRRGLFVSAVCGYADDMGRVLWVIAGLVLIVLVFSAIGRSHRDAPRSYSAELRENCAREFPGDPDGQRECEAANVVRTIAEDRADRISRAAP